MPGISFSIPNVLATQPAGNLAASLLDANWNAIQSALSGLVAALADLPLARDYTGFQAWADGGNIVSAATINLADANSATITGNTGITAISNKQAGAIIILRFTGTPTITHSATLILQGAVDAQCAAGDVYCFKSDAPGTWREMFRRLTTNADATHFLAGDGVLRIPASTSGVTILDRAVVAVTASNTAAETTLYTFSVPGNTLGSTKTLRLSLDGDFLNTTGVARIPRIRMYYGATVFFDNGTNGAAQGSSATRRAMRITGEVTAANATNAQIGSGRASLSQLSGVAGISAVVGSSGGGGNNGDDQMAINQGLAEDSTAAKVIKVTVTMPVADPTLTMTASRVALELV